MRKLEKKEWARYPLSWISVILLKHRLFWGNQKMHMPPRKKDIKNLPSNFFSRMSFCGKIEGNKSWGRAEELVKIYFKSRQKLETLQSIQILVIFESMYGYSRLPLQKKFWIYVTNETTNKENDEMTNNWRRDEDESLDESLNESY